MSSQNRAGCVWRLTEMGKHGSVPITELHVPPTALHLQTTELFLSHLIMAWVLSLIYHRCSLKCGFDSGNFAVRQQYEECACDGCGLWLHFCMLRMIWKRKALCSAFLFVLFYNLLADICVLYIPAVLWLLWDITVFLSVSVSPSLSLFLINIYYSDLRRRRKK